MSGLYWKNLRCPAFFQPFVSAVYCSIFCSTFLGGQTHKKCLKTPGTVSLRQQRLTNRIWVDRPSGRLSLLFVPTSTFDGTLQRSPTSVTLCKKTSFRPCFCRCFSIGPSFCLNCSRFRYHSYLPVKSIKQNTVQGSRCSFSGSFCRGAMCNWVCDRKKKA